MKLSEQIKLLTGTEASLTAGITVDSVAEQAEELEAALQLFEELEDDKQRILSAHLSAHRECIDENKRLKKELEACELNLATFNNIY